MRIARLKVVLLLLVGLMAAGCGVSSPSYSLSCLYGSSEQGLIDDSACAAPDGKTFRFSPRALAQADYGDNGLAGFFIDRRVFYVKPDGSSLEVLLFDNGPDYFEEGLTRGIVNGKVGFFNQRLEPVIEPQYDFAWPFENGLARVGMDCESILDGEHTVVSCRQENYIDRQGRKVEPPVPAQ
ncbi:hypothetical protein SOASR030_14890 [Leminorella grimontii]|uniref:WG repeat-containing protein n=1 Tax=Leminorella grimontii TaxID=82981 RepID=A0AAV5N3X0_9GAMM|nr:WG repeat-containing protein [Leminorella grimontii]KFC97790.1 hypothetical protein GLGR_0204 [Leminorella grimontii ATCC 33999 = DSM 5078]GKX55377.1 hypothetical protein SOASR030_14890 [Leminorella grimontii]VFS56411.1 Uncharacterised protein [Leminorella grimontii]